MLPWSPYYVRTSHGVHSSTAVLMPEPSYIYDHVEDPISISCLIYPFHPLVLLLDPTLC